MISRVAVSFLSLSLSFFSVFLSGASPGRASLHGKASLQIDPVRSEDQGWYECRVLMLEQQSDTFHNGSWVHLTVNGESPAHGADRLCSVFFFVSRSVLSRRKKNRTTILMTRSLKKNVRWSAFWGSAVVLFILIIVTKNNWRDLFFFCFINSLNTSIGF